MDCILIMLKEPHIHKIIATARHTEVNIQDTIGRELHPL